MEVAGQNHRGLAEVEALLFPLGVVEVGEEQIPLKLEEVVEH